MTQTEVTAGFRNAEWTLNALPEGTNVGVFPLRTIDGAATNGFLYRRDEPKAIVCIIHPREFLATHYMIPPLIEAGSGVFTQTRGRWATICGSSTKSRCSTSPPE
jgi:hypothetical protein